MGCGAYVSFLSSLAAGRTAAAPSAILLARRRQAGRGAAAVDATLARANGFTDDIAARRRGSACGSPPGGRRRPGRQRRSRPTRDLVLHLRSRCSSPRMKLIPRTAARENKDAKLAAPDLLGPRPAWSAVKPIGQLAVVGRCARASSRPSARPPFRRPRGEDARRRLVPHEVLLLARARDVAVQFRRHRLGDGGDLVDAHHEGSPLSSMFPKSAMSCWHAAMNLVGSTSGPCCVFLAASLP